ncbi:MAG: hypothetical protein ACRD3P_13955 [Terriglobales bacterium]
MINRLSLLRRVLAYWIAACESWKLAGMAIMPNVEREKYIQRHVLPALKQQTLAATFELSAGRRPYDSINMLIDAAIAARLT